MAPEAAAWLASAILAGLAVFQAALIAGAPLGRFAWGGGQAVLPTRMRVGSAISILLYALFALALLERAGVTDLIASGTAIRVFALVLTAYFALGVFLNGISRSRPERFTMTPVALCLAVLSAIVASSPQPE